MRGLMKSHFASSLLGGLVVAAVFLVVGDTTPRSTQTIVEQSPVMGEPATSKSSGLTPHEIYARDAPGVVFVRAQVIEQVQGPFDLFPQQQSSVSTGSGFLIDAAGHILTNFHVIEGADRRMGVTVQFQDEALRHAAVVGQDADDDLALLKVNMAGVQSVPALALGDSATVRVGDPTLAIGNPFGLDRTLTSGIVSALQREIQAPDGFSIDNVIQTDAPINPGNSGGPLLDAAGRVIGINSQIATTAGGSGGSVGIAFAVPINTARELLPRLENGGQVAVAYLGVQGAPTPSPAPGVIVQQVAPGGPAAHAGVRPGDEIEAIDGRKVSSMSDVQALVQSRAPGQAITLQTVRAHRPRTIKALLGSRATG